MKVDDLAKFVAIIGAVGIVVAIIVTLMNTLELEQRDSTIVFNETITGYTEDTEACYLFQNNLTPCQITLVYNQSSEPVNANSYVLCSESEMCGINISPYLEPSASNLSTDSADQINVSYIASAQSSASGAYRSGFTALLEIPNSWISVIVTVGVLGIVLLMVFGAFAYFKGGRY